MIFIGPNDLSHSMGYPGQMHHPKVKALVKEASARIRAAGKVPGTLVVNETAEALQTAPESIHIASRDLAPVT